MYPYKNSLVRDLAWACFAPPIVDMDILSTGKVTNCALLLTPERERWLLELDVNPKPLQGHVEKLRSHRLGIYFESLWHFFLQQDPGVDLITHNLPIRNEGKTIGEFDCIYYCHQRRRYIHLELAVKYFLSVDTHQGMSEHQGLPESSDLNQWWGPECKDRLDLKVSHLLDRQINLSDHPASKQALNDLGVEQLDKEIEIKGYLFQSIDNPIPLPKGYNRTDIPDQWVHLPNLLEYCETMEATGFKHLPKFQWLSPAVERNTSDTLTDSELEQLMLKHFEGDSRPQLVAALDATGVECCRFFVVGKVWPFGNGERS